MAIALWLEARDTERRISFEPGTRQADRLHQYLAFLNTGFTGAFYPMWVALEAQEATEGEKETLRKFGRQFVALRHAQLEAMMGDSDYLLGGRPTLADAVFAGVARWADFHQAIEPRDYPRILELRRRIEADPAFRFALAIEDGKPAIGSGAMTGPSRSNRCCAIRAAPRRDADAALSAPIHPGSRRLQNVEAVCHHA